MSQDKIAIRIVPTPATQDISQSHVARLSRITKLSAERVRERISQGKSIVIVTAKHPKVDDLIALVKSMGFSVTSGPAIRTKEQPHQHKTKSRARVPLADEWNVGDVIENLYEVRDIKQGGMGAVYIVRHRRWNAMMAVKSLLKRLRENEEDRALFIKEAETWIDIGFHPNIASCYYVRNINDSPRIFIEYVDGGALNEWLSRRTNVDWRIVIDLMVQVCDGLHHAHSKGLVHRDVKPGNCMLTRDGILKVTDFGLTKRQSVEATAEASSDVQRVDNVTIERESITAAGMGTPGYMAPEMWIPYSDVGPQADIYAFGVMFFEICCGRKPFIVKQGERRDKLALAHVKKPPPRPASIRDDIPGSLENIILRCLAKNPRDRYSTCLEIREELASAYERIVKKRYNRELPDEVKLLSDALNNRAVSLMDLNHRDEAVQALQRAVTADPHHPEAVYNLGLLKWFDTGDAEWELVVKMEEVAKTPEYVGRASELLARCLLAMGDAPRALKACELSLSSEDAGESLLKPYSIALIGIGEEKAAISRLKNYLGDFPDDDEAIGWLIAALVRTGLENEARSVKASLPKGSEISTMTLEEITRRFVFSGLSEILTFVGHNGWVTCAAHFPESPRLLTGARDRTLKVWDTAGGEELQSIIVVGEPPASLWISPDEQTVAVASARSGVPVKMLDLASGRFVGNLQAHEGMVTAMGFSRDGSHILTVVDKGFVRLWAMDGFKAAAKFKIPAHAHAAVVSAEPGSAEIVFAGLDRIVKKVRLPDAETLVFDRGHNEPITALTATEGGRRVLTSDRDKVVIVWDGHTGKAVKDFRAHQEHVTMVALNPVRNLAASYDPKAGIKVWDIVTGMGRRTFNVESGEIQCLHFTPTGDGLIGGGKDMTVRMWDVRGRQVMPAFALAKIRPVKKQMKSDRKFKAMMEASRTAIKRGAYATAYTLVRDAQGLAGYERSDTALDILWSMKEHGIRVALHGGWKRKSFQIPSGVMSVSFSPSAINFLTAQADHTIKVWSTRTGECLKVLSGHTNLVASLRLSLNGREVVSGSDDRSVRVWDLNSGRNTLVLKGHTGSVSCVAYSHDGEQVLSGSWDGTIRLWNLPEGTPIRTIRGHEDNITSAQFINNSEHIVSAGFSGIVKMWEASSGRILRELKGHKEQITCLSTSPDGTLLLSGSMDGTVRVWDVRRGTCIKTVSVNETGVRDAAFSPDQRFFVTGGSDCAVGVWSVETGESHREFQGHSREITSTQFSTDGRFIISSSSDGVIMIWELDWDWQFGDKRSGARFDDA
ncbi:MAG: protein kinase [Desulfomonilaceae bacterium]|nr:protein kinase [Desulfomonilaceae bacterium]